MCDCALEAERTHVAKALEGLRQRALRVPPVMREAWLRDAALALAEAQRLLQQASAA